MNNLFPLIIVLIIVIFGVFILLMIRNRLNHPNKTTLFKNDNIKEQEIEKEDESFKKAVKSKTKKEKKSDDITYENADISVFEATSDNEDGVSSKRDIKVGIKKEDQYLISISKSGVVSMSANLERKIEPRRIEKTKDDQTIIKKVVKIGLKKEKGLIYSIDNEGDVSVAEMIQGASSKKIMKVGVKMVEGYSYFIDKDGDISAAKEVKKETIVRRSRKT